MISSYRTAVDQSNDCAVIINADTYQLLWLARNLRFDELDLTGSQAT
jgi:hypothetical protein